LPNSYVMMEFFTFEFLFIEAKLDLNQILLKDWFIIFRLGSRFFRLELGSNILVSFHL